MCKRLGAKNKQEYKVKIVSEASDTPQPQATQSKLSDKNVCGGSVCETKARHVNLLDCRAAAGDACGGDRTCK